jgi:hypothetical protein
VGMEAFEGELQGPSIYGAQGPVAGPEATRYAPPAPCST